jgi:hypothetical protein
MPAYPAGPRSPLGERRPAAREPTQVALRGLRRVNGGQPSRDWEFVPRRFPGVGLHRGRPLRIRRDGSGG